MKKIMRIKKPEGKIFLQPIMGDCDNYWEDSLSWTVPQDGMIEVLGESTASTSYDESANVETRVVVDKFVHSGSFIQVVKGEIVTMQLRARAKREVQVESATLTFEWVPGVTASGEDIVLVERWVCPERAAWAGPNNPHFEVEIAGTVLQVGAYGKSSVDGLKCLAKGCRERIQRVG